MKFFPVFLKMVCIFILPSILLATESSFYISVLKPPIPIFTDHGVVLVYELQIVNGSDKEIKLALVEVHDHTGKPLLAYSAEELNGNTKFFKEGDPIDNKEMQLKNGMTAFVYFWLVVPKNEIPRELQHRVWLIGAEEDKNRVVAQSLSFSLPLELEPPVVIRSPLRGVNWVASKGPSPYSHYRRAIFSIEGNFYLAQRFATDWQQICLDGLAVKGSVLKNDHWIAFGQEVTAVSDGIVSAVQDGIVENIPLQFPKDLSLAVYPGNFVITKIRENNKDYFVLYAHLQSGSIQVKQGDKVTQGQPLASVGNTGYGGIPSLHFQISDGNDPLKSEGVPFMFSEVDLTGITQPLDPLHGLWKPIKGKNTGLSKNVVPMQNQLFDFSKESRYKCP